MQPPTKDQADIGLDTPVLDASDGAELPDGTNNQDMARQEFAQEADINYMLSKFGITQPRGTPTFGEWDDTVDLQQAITSTREAKQAFGRLPEELRKKFNSMDELLAAVTSGDLVIKDEPAPEPPA